MVLAVVEGVPARGTPAALREPPRVRVDGNPFERDPHARGAGEAEEVEREPVADVHHRGRAGLVEPAAGIDARLDREVAAERAPADRTGEDDVLSLARPVATGRPAPLRQVPEGRDRQRDRAGSRRQVAADEVGAEGARALAGAAQGRADPGLLRLHRGAQRQQDGARERGRRGEVGERARDRLRADTLGRRGRVEVDALERLVRTEHRPPGQRAEDGGVVAARAVQPTHGLAPRLSGEPAVHAVFVPAHGRGVVPPHGPRVVAPHVRGRPLQWPGRTPS